MRPPTDAPARSREAHGFKSNLTAAPRWTRAAARARFRDLLQPAAPCKYRLKKNLVFGPFPLSN
jgi:hypothetical protein